MVLGWNAFIHLVHPLPHRLTDPGDWTPREVFDLSTRREVFVPAPVPMGIITSHQVSRWIAIPCRENNHLSLKPLGDYQRLERIITSLKVPRGVF